VNPEPQTTTNDAIQMSSMWNDARMKPWNVFKTQNFNANWGQGEFTCIHTLNDKDGPWWMAKFGAEVTVTKIQLLNRGDCCGSRLNKAKVFIGDATCGTIENPPQGEWVSVNCKAKGSFLKIQATPGQYLHFCGLKIWQYSGTETIVEEEEDRPEPVQSMTTAEGHTVVPEEVGFANEWITMSS